jgi:CDP-diacylglycerol---glycerol-3-phosphate 3-phosphatidyltransferase
LNLPNALTALRIFLVPLLVVVLLTRVHHHVFLGAGIFGLAALTDYLDGYFARRRNQITRVGILLDPLADKLLTAAAFLSLVELGAVPAWMVMIILGREFAVTGLRNVAAGRGLLVPASALGKGKMVAQVVCILLLLLGRRYTLLQPLGLAALWVVVVLALVSGADYFRLFWREVVRGPSAPRPVGERPAPPPILPRGGAVDAAAAIAAPRDRRS